jgi:alkylation response protein AidB-like acyl-CoA dehydrogenase
MMLSPFSQNTARLQSYRHVPDKSIVAGELDSVTASMAKYWCSQKQVETADECLQLHGGYGNMEEYPISRMFVDARIQKIYGGTNEIMKLLIARSLYAQSRQRGASGLNPAFVMTLAASGDDRKRNRAIPASGC